MARIFSKIKHDLLPQSKKKYPYIYLERGRLEVNDSSVIWIDSENRVISIPVCTLASILLGPGTSVTHAAIKILAQANCNCQWVGEDSLLYYSFGISPTANTKNLDKQINLAFDSEKRRIVAGRMFNERFDRIGDNLTIDQMMGIEGHRVKSRYLELANQYNIRWEGRSFIPGKFNESDLTNKIITSGNTALYGIVTSVVLTMGYSPHIGFIHKGSPLPFVYDVADLYKDKYTIEFAFSITKELNGVYNKEFVSCRFRENIIKNNLMEKIPKDINKVLKEV